MQELENLNDGPPQGRLRPLGTTFKAYNFSQGGQLLGLQGGGQSSLHQNLIQKFIFGRGYALGPTKRFYSFPASL